MDSSFRLLWSRGTASTMGKRSTDLIHAATANHTSHVARWYLAIIGFIVAHPSVPLMSISLEDTLKVVCAPGWEDMLSVIVLVWSLDVAFSQIYNFAHSLPTQKHHFLGSRIRFPTVVLSLLYCAVMFLSISFSVFLYPFGNARDVLAAVTLFLLVSDVDAFLGCSQCFMASFLANGTALERSPTVWLLFTFRKSAFTQEKLINALVKLFGFGVGATCGYRRFETVCRIVLIQLFVYTVILIHLSLLIWLTTTRGFSLSVTMNLQSKQLVGSTPVSMAVRRRSRSCSAKVQSYPERLPVSVSTVLQHNPNLRYASPVLDRIKYLMTVTLCLLCLHNQFVTWLGEDQEFDTQHASNTTAFQYATPPSFFIRFFRWQWFRLFNRATLNLSLFVITAVLLYHRAKLRAARHAELLDFTVGTDASFVGDTTSKVGEEVKWMSTNGTPPFSSTSQRTASAIETHLPTERLPARKACDDELATECSIRARLPPDAFVADDELLKQLSMGKLKTRDLESLVRNPNRAVELRRADLCRLLSNPHALERLPFREYDYRFVHGQCCEEVIGFIPIPVGKVGPLLLDGRSHYLPLATTEGCLVASTNRGCRALFLSGGAKSAVFRDQMTRAPVVWFPSVLEVVQCIAWIESTEGFQSLKSVFDRTSGHINLISVFPNPTGHYLHIRFSARTGDAMGMNMVSKATNAALHELQRHFPTMQVISLSGNMCTDKKAATINTTLGRGKSVIVESCLPATVLAQVLHTTAARLTRLAHAKNWTGSAMAGCPGMMGCNAHAANIVAGLFAATGQDLAQVVDAAACLTQFEVGDNESLVVSVTMPCIEVGTIGGGTRLPAQRACLDILDLSVDKPTEHLARLIAGTVLAGELSLMAALDTDDLVSAHLRLNRSTIPVTKQIEQSIETSASSSSVRTTAVSGFLVKSDASGRLEPPHAIM
ncbi:hypothetical protein T265_09380 [Opisthorchis viverrini]|uniref:3-hydroxy-3-methylglutaryl-coenzyme A reductase n=1 Tax=Opisthorchis viverrini TaxID=6198 RepID=A0A074ZH50_OPIVI|nr:hypothetical protein T265_09380 [Opisthorchis viverrini]KER22550.1 hypothetical protein T265_09380 [Opisthorchis viverrini]